MPTCHIVIDLEMNPTAECQRGICHGLKNETIEIGAVKIDASTNKIVDSFTCVIVPQFNYRIEPKITKLTGITTRDVRSGKTFEEGLRSFVGWVGCDTARVYSWSNTDFSQISKECAAKDIPFPETLSDWTDFQAEYPKYLGYPERRCLNLSEAARIIGTTVAPDKVHRALYDAEITAALVLFVLTGEYKSYSQQVAQSISSRSERLTCTIGDSCKGKLEALLAQMKKDAIQEENPDYGTMYAHTTPEFVQQNQR